MTDPDVYLLVEPAPTIPDSTTPVSVSLQIAGKKRKRAFVEVVASVRGWESAHIIGWEGESFSPE